MDNVDLLISHGAWSIFGPLNSEPLNLLFMFYDDISDRLNIRVIIIMRIYGTRGYFIFIHVLEDIFG
jgi:hypothetical protein